MPLVNVQTNKNMTRNVLFILITVCLWIGCSGNSGNGNINNSNGNYQANSTPSDCITADDAKNSIGKKSCVCGKVVSATYSTRSKGQPTFLNLDRPYPNQIFTIVIWGSDRSKFGSPENDYRGKTICVTGQIEAFKGKPEIIVKEKSQISIKE